VPRQKAKAFRLFAKQHRAQIAVALTDLALLRDGARNGKCLQSPADERRGVDSAFAFFRSAIALPSVYAQTALSNAMGCTPLTMVSGSTPFARQSAIVSSRVPKPFSFRQAVILGILLSMPSNCIMFTRLPYCLLGSIYAAAPS
jgi:hypothetical protein